MSKFKIGDKVRVKEAIKVCLEDSIYPGDTCEIIEVDYYDTNLPYMIVNQKHIYCWVCSNDIVFAEPHPCFSHAEIEDMNHATEEMLKEDKPEQAKRFNFDKIDFFDAPLLGIVEVSKVAKYGRSKYDAHNWKKDAPLSQYIDCALRHLIKCQYGQDVDSESGCMHLAHAAWNCLAAIEKKLVEKEVDDRHRYDSDYDLESLFSLNDEQKEIIEKMTEKRNK